MECIKGQCFCGNVKYTVNAAILKMGVCFCSQCQKITGGSSWPFVVVLNESLTITGDAFREFTRVGFSGKNVHMGFCCKCSTSLFGRPEVWPEIRTVSASTLDNRDLFKPEMNVWTEEAPSWMLFDSSIPNFPKNPI